MISGHTRLIAHLGAPTHGFRAPLIYNPYFEHVGIDAVVMPMGCGPEDFPSFLPAVARLTNFAGALVTMPRKVAVVGLLDETSVAVQVCGACNAVRRETDGRLVGDMFDGEGFVRGMERRGRAAKGASALVIGSGGVGSAIAASLAGAGLARIGLHDARPSSAEALGARLAARRPVSRAGYRNRLQRSRGIRHRRQRHAAGHGRRRPGQELPHDREPNAR